MKVIKKTAQYTVYQKRSGRYAVMGSARNWINGDEKAAILLADGLIKVTAPKASEPEVEDTAAEESTDTQADAAPEAGESVEVNE